MTHKWCGGQYVLQRSIIIIIIHSIISSINYRQFLIPVVHSSPLDPVPQTIKDGAFTLNPFIRYHEPARYDRHVLEVQHRRAKRSTTSSSRREPLRLTIRTQDRVFRLRLNADTTLFADDVEFVSTRGKITTFDPSAVYTGTLEDDETAVVHGIVTTDGLFDGTVSTQTDDFYIEPVNRYITPSSSSSSSSPSYHSIIYRTNDVIHPYDVIAKSINNDGRPLTNQQIPCASHLLKNEKRNRAKTMRMKNDEFFSSSSFATEQMKLMNKEESSEKLQQQLQRNSSHSSHSSRAKRWLPEDENEERSYDFGRSHHLYNRKPSTIIISTFPKRQNNTAPVNNHNRTTSNIYRNIITKSTILNKNNINTFINKINNRTTTTNHNHNVDFRRPPVYLDPPPPPPPPPATINDNEIRNLFEFPEAELDLLTPLNNNSNSADLLFRHVHKRATIDPKKTTCLLYLQADHQFFQKYGTEEACIEVMTRHVQRVNAIYRVTDFNQDGKPDNISFMIKRIKVHSMDALNDPLYRFPNNYGVEKFLELFSEEDYDAFCLAYMFTYRDFEMGTLGLAWTGDLKNAGGVCEKNGHYRGSMKSLNTGIVTLLNYGKHVPPAVSHVTLAHEIGHNFGSPHDPELCTPGGEDGNFIMFARATSGDKKNNNQFSPCSLKSINPVLNYKARSSKGCFTEPQTSLCGNGVVEDGEECDCGWEEDCRDQCCHPQRRHPPPDEPPCKLTPSSICSPSQGPCCTSECQLKFGDKCRDDNGCRDASFCDGRGPQCPPSINKPNKTICNEEFVCFMGECTGSICLAYGLESCQCIPGPHDPKTKACELCCKMPGDGQPCRSSFEWNKMPYDIPDMYSKPGTPCNDYNGYCDVFQKCREVDPSGPLATLRKMLLSEESIASFKKYLIDYWYVAVLVVSMIFAILVLIAKIFGKQPNLKLKSVTIIHSSTTETVRLPPEGEGGQVTVHPAIRSKLPLKQKVRNGKKRRPHRPKDISSSNNSSPKKSGKTFLKNQRAIKKPNKVDPRKRISKESDGSNSRNKKSSNNKATPSKNRKKKKETIDYSATQKESKTILTSDMDGLPTTPDADTDPVGKVQNWLLKSQLPVVIPKSKSTPAALTERSNRSPHKPKTTVLRPTGDKSKSVGHLPGDKEKMRLQVIYKPPFKFSVKLRKADKSSVVVDRSGQRVADRSSGGNVRSSAATGATTNVGSGGGQRAGLLVRTVKEHNPHRHRSSEKVQVPSSMVNTPAIPAPLVTPPIRLNGNSSPALATNVNMLNDDHIDSNVHTVQSDLEVLLSESEFLFSDG